MNLIQGRLGARNLARQRALQAAARARLAPTRTRSGSIRISTRYQNGAYERGYQVGFGNGYTLGFQAWSKNTRVSIQ